MRNELAGLATRVLVVPVNRIENPTLQSTISQMEGGVLREEQQIEKLKKLANRVK